MNLALGLIALLILATSTVALSLRKLVHAALLLVVTWFGIAAFYLWAGAEFVAFAQILIYAGAISMVVLFAVLLTRPSSDLSARSPESVRRAISGLFVGAAVAAAMAYAVLQTSFAPVSSTPPVSTVREIGVQLMGPHIAAVLIIGLILTASLIGAIVVASSPVTAKEEEIP